MEKLQEANSLDVLTKQKVLEMLGNEGYATYARRLKNIDFHVAYFYKGTYCPAAFMSPEDMCIVVNPGFVVDMAKDGPIFKQLSVIVRHELLHFLLCHEKRFHEYLMKTDPNYAQTYKRVDMHTLANFAMDYELGNYGYDDYDKQVIKNMKLNGQVISGLLSEDVKNDTTSVWGAGIINGQEVYHGVEFNNWGDKSMEDMFQMLRDAHEKLLATKGPTPNNPTPQTPQQDPNQPSNSGRSGQSNNQEDSENDTEQGQDQGQGKSNNQKQNSPANPENADDEDADSDEKGNDDNSSGKQSKNKEQDQDPDQGSQSASGKPDEEENNASNDANNSEDDNNAPGHDEISGDFADAWNEVLAKYDTDEYSPEDLDRIISQIQLGSIKQL